MGLGVGASSVAGRVDALFWWLTGLSALIAAGVAIALVTFAIKYRRRSPDEVPVQIEGALRLELTWTLIPLVLSIITFLWAAILYMQMSRPAENALEIFVQGRQWMWKAQHPTGQWENNELHVPINRPIKLSMTSLDVIHNFGVPAFRVRQDVLPGRYTVLPFTATKPGVYNIFCSEYCGAFHSGMVGRLTAMEPRDYELWLSGATTMESPAAAGQRLAQNLGCTTCHREDSRQQAPSWVGLYGSTVTLDTGQKVTADDEYIRESILYPQRQIVAGYRRPSIMPTFQGQVNETQLMQIIAYIRSLGGANQQQPGGSTTLPTTDATPGLEPNSGAPGGGSQDEP
jgi:cytochrome c oxidase subunit 2